MKPVRIQQKPCPDSLAARYRLILLEMMCGHGALCTHRRHALLPEARKTWATQFTRAIYGKTPV
jgi:hypothetical protein